MRELVDDAQAGRVEQQVVKLGDHDAERRGVRLLAPPTDVFIIRQRQWRVLEQALALKDLQALGLAAFVDLSMVDTGAREPRELLVAARARRENAQLRADGVCRQGQ